MPQRVPCRVAPDPATAASSATPPLACAATANREVAAAGAEPPRWWDICDCLWRIFGCGLRRGRRHRSSGGGGIGSSSTQRPGEVDRLNGGRDPVGKRNNGRNAAGRNIVCRGNAAGRNIVRRRSSSSEDGGVVPGDGDDQSPVTDRLPEPLMVNGVAVSDEALKRYAIYCEDRLKYKKQVLCHMCVLDEEKYFGKNHCLPIKIPTYCRKKHNNVGLKCEHPDCSVRVSTKDELIVH